MINIASPQIHAAQVPGCVHVANQLPAIDAAIRGAVSFHQSELIVALLLHASVDCNAGSQRKRSCGHCESKCSGYFSFHPYASLLHRYSHTGAVEISLRVRFAASHIGLGIAECWRLGYSHIDVAFMWRCRSYYIGSALSRAGNAQSS